MSAAICSTAGCTGQARWIPFIVARPPWPLSGEAPAKVCHAFCEACQRVLKLEVFLTEQRWACISGALVSGGKPPPDRARTRLRWELLS